MEIKVCIKRYDSFEFRTVSIDIEPIVEEAIRDQCEGIFSVDLEADIDIDGIVFSSIEYPVL